MNPEPDRGNAYEILHVHNVYDQIASHFSSTRYKPWPIVEQFLKSLSPGSVGLDIGCGNGKYLGINPNICIIASDRSENLVKIAGHSGLHNAIVADGLFLPHRTSSMDFAISVAVIHHLSSPARRILAVESILATLRPHSSPQPSLNVAADGGKVLMVVWALEQKCSRRGWDECDEQDVMVPWVTQLKNPSTGEIEAKTYRRYYHLYRRGELEDDVLKAGGIIVESGYEKDNWWAVAMLPPPRKLCE
ncbi:tRNA methyltransferase, has a role in tRNA modification [Lambiella insularis]|nr:tRNA methyltransferase, has a role in tRNA modification [Lambiella insularis]